MNGESWSLLLMLAIGGALYWAWHVWRWRKIGCAKCGGSGSFRSKSLVLRHPVQRPCPRCTGRGRAPWRRRKWSPDPDRKN